MLAVCSRTADNAITVAWNDARGFGDLGSDTVSPCSSALITGDRIAMSKKRPRANTGLGLLSYTIFGVYCVQIAALDHRFYVSISNRLEWKAITPVTYPRIPKAVRK